MVVYDNVTELFGGCVLPTAKIVERNIKKTKFLTYSAIYYAQHDNQKREWYKYVLTDINKFFI